MNNFNWEEFKKGNIVVWCGTRELSNNFLKECDKQNIVWGNGIMASSMNCYDDICYNYKCMWSSLVFSDKEFYIKKGCKIIEWNLDEKKDEFTFQELISMNKVGKYICTNKNVRVEKIEILKQGDIKFTTTTTLKKEFGLSPNFRFKLQEPKKMYGLYEVIHAEGGKHYTFRGKGDLDSIFQTGEWVVCDTSMGKSFGRVAEVTNMELTEKEYLNYKECWRA